MSPRTRVARRPGCSNIHRRCSPPASRATSRRRSTSISTKVDVDLSIDASATTNGDATATTSSSSSQSKPYGYGAVRPTRFDSEGRITAFTIWPVQCGPPPPKNAKGEDVAPATLKPLPGIVMKKGDPVCTTTSVAALRNAARASEAWAPQPPRESHWVRDAQQ
jgi:hypothetical protein